MRILRNKGTSFEEEITPRSVELVDDVFAVYEHDGLLCLAAGDDGHWWEIASYHPFWGPPMATALGAMVARLAAQGKTDIHYKPEAHA